MSARVGVLLLVALVAAVAPAAAASRLGLAGLGVDVCETYSSEECREHPDKCTPCRVRTAAAAAAPGAACHLPPYCRQPLVGVAPLASSGAAANRLQHVRPLCCRPGTAWMCALR